MTNNQIVEAAYRKHNSWLLQVAFNFTKNKLDAENLVQDLYLRLLEMKDIEKILYNKDINLFYLYKMLKSMYINETKKQIRTLPIDEDLYNMVTDDYDMAADQDFEENLTLVNEALEKGYWFDVNLLKIYLDEDHSIQSLHDATGISNSTIWTSMQKTKKYVREYVKAHKKD